MKEEKCQKRGKRAKEWKRDNRRTRTRMCSELFIFHPVPPPPFLNDQSGLKQIETSKKLQAAKQLMYECVRL